MESQQAIQQLQTQSSWWNISYSWIETSLQGFTLIISMFNYSARRSTKKKALELHQILRDYKRFEEEKLMLQNRINIMHNNQVKNNNKARSIQQQYMRIKFAHDQRKENEKAIQNQIMEFKTQEASKKREMIKKIKEEKKKIETSKKFYAEFNQQEGRRVKSESKVIYEKLMANTQSQIAQKQRRRKQVNDEQRRAKSRVNVFRTSRLNNLKAEQTEKVLEQLKVNNSAEYELKNLQKMQKEMILKYSESLSSLKNSRSKIKKLASIRA